MPSMRHVVHIMAACTLLATAACSDRVTAPRATIHYLGHSAFVFTFDNGLTVLTDYGKSRAYGLDSPIFGLGGLRPDVMTRSHDHPDHAGGSLPDGYGQLVTDGGRFEGNGLTITPIPTFEGTLDTADNTSYLFEYRGVKILHLGDCQALIVAIEDSVVQERVRTLYPDSYDLVLVPIGFVRDILDEAAQFVTLLDARRVIPMHYWNPADRDTFLELLENEGDARGRRYRVRAELGATLRLDRIAEADSVVEAIGLTPGPLRLR
jgi:L-ascorbate metabolism protein UlaG (beta-lactamase superfamily)